MRLPTWLAPHVAALRALLVLTVVLGLAYPLAVTGIATLPGLRDRTTQLGASFTDADGAAKPQYFQSRPSAGGYDPKTTGASNLGPESVVDTLPDPSVKDDTGTRSLLTQVCSRSLAAGALDGVSGARPFCARSGDTAVGAVLAVFHAGGLTGPVTRAVSVNQACPVKPFVTGYDGVRVSCMTFGEDVSTAVITPIRGSAGRPAVPGDAVTASGSGLDPDISPAYAAIQVARVARERGAGVADVRKLVAEYSSGRQLGFLGEPVVEVVKLNAALDRAYPARG